MADQLQSLTFTLYGTAMVRSGMKTQVRIAVYPQPADGHLFTLDPNNPDDLKGAYLLDKARPAVPDQPVASPMPGAMLWVAEPFFLPAMFDSMAACELAKRTARGGSALTQIPIGYETDQTLRNWPDHMTIGRVRPGSKMPLWGSRSTCIVGDARHGRLRDMVDSDGDALGVEIYKKWKNNSNRRAYDVHFRYRCQGGKAANAATIEAAYFKAWDRRHKAGDLKAAKNPFVTVISFRHVAMSILQFEAELARTLQAAQ